MNLNSLLLGAFWLIVPYHYTDSFKKICKTEEKREKMITNHILPPALAVDHVTNVGHLVYTVSGSRSVGTIKKRRGRRAGSGREKERVRLHLVVHLNHA